MTIIIKNGFTLRGSEEWVDDISEHLDLIAEVPKGRELITYCQGVCFEEESNRISPVTTGLHDLGAYNLEKHVLNKKWREAVVEVLIALHSVRKTGSRWIIGVLRNDLRRGVPSITTADEMNRRREALTGQEPAYINIMTIGGEVVPIDTSRGFTPNSPFFELVDLITTGMDLWDPPDWVADKLLLMNDPDKKRGFYIILRRLKPFLRQGPGVRPAGITIECSSDWDWILEFEGFTPAIVLAHELIHAYHSIKGIAFLNKHMEEAQTVGIHPFEYEKFTENVFRTQLKGKKSGEYETDRLRIHYKPGQAKKIMKFRGKK